MCSPRVRTMGGPPSLDERECMKREMENVLHGGAAMIARNSPLVARSSRGRYTGSLKDISSLPPPMLRIAVYAGHREAPLPEECGKAVVALVGPREQQEDVLGGAGYPPRSAYRGVECLGE